MNPKKFLAELQRRNVYKVAVAYAVVSWLLIQIATQIFPVFEIPNWGARMVIVALALGFPMALILAWAYELTPEGIKPTGEVELRKPFVREKGRTLDFVIIGVLVAVIAVMTAGYFRRAKAVGPGVPEKSIAVLPFENRSEDKANAYFADGVQDEILTRLSKVTDLKVISRTSTRHYKSAPDNLREIGKQLGVANLLEGSVQKKGNTVLVNVQLIRAATNEHLWGESYNRQLDDIFSVETEVANAIVDKLNARLSGAEKQDLAAKPTSNPEAHDAFLRGLAFSERSYLLEADVTKALQAFENAVRLDPNFALAWAHLSKMHSTIFVYSDASAARRDSALKALENALRLQPDSLDTQLAEGYYHYRVVNDYDRAREIFERVHSKWPNNSEAPRRLALVARRQGRWDESLAHFRKALELDPRNLQTLTDASVTAQRMRQYQMAFKFIDRALDIAPGDNSTLAIKAGIHQALGQLDQADAVLTRMHKDANDETAIEAMVNQLLLRHDFASGVVLMQSTLAKLDSALLFEQAAFLSFLGDFQQLGGDAAGAKDSHTQSREKLESLLREQPDNPRLIGWLAIASARLGDKEGAVRLMEQALEKLAAANDLFERPVCEESLAQFQAQAGDKDRAITTVRRLLSTNGATITPAILRLHPNWNSLRDDPRFQALTVNSSTSAK